MTMMSKSDSLRKAAILMVALGEECAAEVVKHLNSDEVQRLGTAMATMKQVTRSEVNQVMEEFRTDAEQFLSVSLGSASYIRDILTRAMGPDRAAGILEDILESGNAVNGIDALNSLEPTAIVELISEEHPQIIATILVHLDRDRASGVLTLLSERLRNDVILRIATFGGVQPSALYELTDVLNGVLSGQSAKRSKLGGVRTAAEILNAMNGTEEAKVLAVLRERDAELAQRIQDEMFVFENLADLEDAAIQMILRDVDGSIWPIALKGAKEEVVNRILGNMSLRQAQMIREDLAEQGPIRLSIVEAEQKKVLEVARRLADEGKILLHSAGDDSYV
ncbi:flagellar motor switch protein FliG [Bordetella sp. 15P40C-2]|uniref:flagellar motor switch protein FliG n=1 Tax=Bordetella sp. 15P40C-2 TaxID=2572246 RepID=UPI00351B15CC